MRKLLLLIACCSTPVFVLADAVGLETPCGDCASAYDFALHGTATLEAHWADKTLVQQVFGQVGITPITVHNPHTGLSARIKVSMDLVTNSYSFGFFSVGVPSLDSVSVHAEKLDGSGSTRVTITESLIERTIARKGIKGSDATECAKESCAINEGALDDWTWAAEAAAMNPAITIAMNQRYGYGFGNSWYRSPGACWGTGTGVMCQPY